MILIQKKVNVNLTQNRSLFVIFNFKSMIDLYMNLINEKWHGLLKQSKNLYFNLKKILIEMKLTTKLKIYNQCMQMNQTSISIILQKNSFSFVILYFLIKYRIIQLANLNSLKIYKYNMHFKMWIRDFKYFLPCLSLIVQVIDHFYH